MAILNLLVRLIISHQWCNIVSLFFFFFNLEFLIPISVTTRGNLQEKLEMAFKMFDLNKNNSIDKKEMEKLVMIIYELTGESNKKKTDEATIQVISIMNKLGTNELNFKRPLI